MKKCFFLSLLIFYLTGCNSNYPPIEADDFGFPKFTVLAAGTNVTGVEDKQLSEWQDTGYKYNGTSVVMMVYNPGYNNSSTWTSWGCAGESGLCYNAESYPVCTLAKQNQKYNSPDDLPNYLYTTGKDTSGNNIYDQYSSAPCNFIKGLGLYFLITNTGNTVNNITNPNTYPNINRMPSSANFHTGNLWQGTGMYQNGDLANGLISNGGLESDYVNGRLYLKIMDRYYADNSGSFTVSLKRGFTTIHEPPIASVISYVKKVMDNAANQIFVRLVEEPEFFRIVKTTLIIYMMVQGILYLGGILRMNHKELFFTFLRIVFVVQLLSTETSWNLFNSYFFKMFTTGLDQMISIITSNITGSGESGLTFFDNVFQTFFAYETSTKILSLLVSFPCGFIVIIMIYIGILLFAICIGKAVILYLLSYMAISLLIAMGPVFITFMLFSKTRELFESWLNQFANYFFQPLLVFAFLNVMGQTIITQFYKLLGFKACFGDWLVAGNGFVITQMWQICPFNNTQANIPVPGYGFWDNNNPTTFYNPYEFSAQRYVDLPFLDLSQDGSLISAFKNPYYGLNVPMLFNGLIYLLCCYLMYKFYDTVADIGKEIAGTATSNNTGNGNALNNASSQIYQDVGHFAKQMKDIGTSVTKGQKFGKGGRDSKPRVPIATETSNALVLSNNEIAVSGAAEGTAKGTSSGTMVLKEIGPANVAGASSGAIAPKETGPAKAVSNPIIHQEQSLTVVKKEIHTEPNISIPMMQQAQSRELLLDWSKISKDIKETYKTAKQYYKTYKVLKSLTTDEICDIYFGPDEENPKIKKSTGLLEREKEVKEAVAFAKEKVEKIQGVIKEIRNAKDLNDIVNAFKASEEVKPQLENTRDAKEAPEKDLYKILGVSQDASMADVRKAYLKLSLKHHPDKGGKNEDFHEINQAYKTLQAKFESEVPKSGSAN